MPQGEPMDEGSAGDLDRWFTSHRPSATQAADAVLLRAAARNLARVIADVCPDGPDRTHALILVRYAAMWAVATLMNPPRDDRPETPRPD
jgi:hypothetical protein